MGLTFDSKAFDGTLKEIDKQADKEARNRVNNHLKNVMGYVVPLTPVGKYTGSNKRVGGRLKGGWQLIPAKKSRSKFEYTGYLVNNVDYVKHVEYGHRTRYGTGKATPKEGAKKTVEGQKMLTKAIEKAKRKEGI